MYGKFLHEYTDLIRVGFRYDILFLTLYVIIKNKTTSYKKWIPRVLWDNIPMEKNIGAYEFF